MECFQTVLEYGLQRQIFGRPVAQTQLYQAKLADMAGLIVNSQLLSLHYGRLKDAGQLSPVQVLPAHQLAPVHLPLPPRRAAVSRLYILHVMT